MNEVFEIATREKYRFPFRGSISTEDLWDLNATQLDIVYKNLMAERRADQSDDSLLAEKKDNPELRNKIAIVKYIFDVKQKEVQNAKNEAERKAKKDKLLTVLAQKQDENLHNMSEEDLRKMVEELG